MWFWILGWLFTVLCFIGNGFVVFVIVARRELHTATNMFIASLAVADVCAGVTFFPLFFVSTFYKELDLDHPGFLFKLTFTFLYCSTSNLCVLTADRYIAITRPLRYTVFMTTKLVQWVIFSAWVSPLLLFTLPAMFTYNDNKTYTTFVEICRVVIFQVLPCVVFMFVTIRLLYIARRFCQQTVAVVNQIGFNHPFETITISQNSIAKRKSSIAMVVLVITVFNVAHIGANYRCFCFLSEMCEWSGIVMKVGDLFLIANLAINPFAYAFFKKDIRKELFQVFKW